MDLNIHTERIIDRLSPTAKEILGFDNDLDLFDYVYDEFSQLFDHPTFSDNELGILLAEEYLTYYGYKIKDKKVYFPNVSEALNTLQCYDYEMFNPQN